MEIGKLPPEVLARYVLSRLGAPAGELVVPPAPGHDACALKLGDRYLVMASDPALGVPTEHLGHLAIHFTASDVAVFGAEPRYVISDILLPPGADEGLLDTITAQMDAACRELGATIIGGHSGVYPALAEPVVVTTAFGLTERVLSPTNLRTGMHILLVKGLGLETACYLAWSRTKAVDELLGTERAASLRAAIRKESCVAEALLLREHAACMHDLTEGGLYGALLEMKAATGLGADLNEAALFMEDDVAAVLDHFGVDSRTCSSTGALIAFVPSGRVGAAIELLDDRGVCASDIGRVTDGPVQVVDGQDAPRPVAAGPDGYSLVASDGCG